MVSHESNMENASSKRVIIIGSGIGGLGTAALLAKDGYEVTVLERGNRPGGRANILEDQGFRFDTGPSLYMMTGVFEHFFALLGERVSDHLDLIRLSPSVRVVFGGTGKTVDMTANLDEDANLFEEFEPGAGAKLKKYVKISEDNYKIATKYFLYKNFDSILDFFHLDIILPGMKLKIFERMQTYVSRYFKSDEIQKLMQYSLVFLGCSPMNAPAMYNLMSHLDFTEGIFYPKGGMYEIVKALVRIAEKNGANIRTACEVKKILVSESGEVKGVLLENGEELLADIVISNADIHHTEHDLLPEQYREHSEKYWEKRVLAPSALILQLGVKGRTPTLAHHNMRFAKNWMEHFADIFEHPEWPKDPSLYICAPSISDRGMAPEDGESLYVLVPIAPGLEYDKAFIKKYGDDVIRSIAKEFNIPDLAERIVVRHEFSVKDFAERYKSYKGTALGLAHTLTQTALFRPSNVSKKVKNLYFVGGNTVPGIGVPICLISAELIRKRLKNDKSCGPTPV